MFIDFSFAQDTVGYMVQGVMDKETISILRDEILRKFEEHEKINLYLEDSGVERFSLDSVVIATLFPHEHRHRFNKVAMVTDRKWIHLISAINNRFVEAEIKNFSIEKRMDAMSWVAR